MRPIMLRSCFHPQLLNFIAQRRIDLLESLILSMQICCFECLPLCIDGRSVGGVLLEKRIRRKLHFRE